MVTGGTAVVTGGTPTCPPCYHLAPVTRYFLPKFPVLCIPEVPFLAELERQIETVSPEGTFCDTVHVPSRGGDMELI